MFSYFRGLYYNVALSPTRQRSRKNSSLPEGQDRQEPSRGNVIPEWARQKSLANGISNGTARCDHNEGNPLELIAASLTKM